MAVKSKARKSKSWLESPRRGDVMKRIATYVGKQIGLARYANTINPGQFKHTMDIEGTFGFFIMNPMEVGVNPGDAELFEKEDYEFCRTMTSGEKHVMIMEITIAAAQAFNEFSQPEVSDGEQKTVQDES